MLKLVIFASGLTIGAAGTAAWMLSDSTPGTTPASPPIPDGLQERLQLVKTRFNEALQEGQRTQQQTEENLRRKLDAYRKGTQRAL